MIALDINSLLFFFYHSLITFSRIFRFTQDPMIVDFNWLYTNMLLLVV